MYDSEMLKNLKSMCPTAQYLPVHEAYMKIVAFDSKLQVWWPFRECTVLTQCSPDMKNDYVD
jgi:hypothetical protein